VALKLVRDKERLAGAVKLANDVEGIPHPEVLETDFFARKLQRREASTGQSTD
jgi:hypothetical protein